MKKTLALGAYAALAIGLAATWGAGDVVAADHAEAPAAVANAAADISDFYSWQTAGGGMVSVITYGGFTAPGDPFICDNTVLYTVHSDYWTDHDNDPLTDTVADQISDAQVHVRFGTTEGGDCGLQATVVSALGSFSVEGPVDTALTEATTGMTVWAGLADDPFFFDQQGYLDTLSSGDLSFTAADAVAGSNVSAIVIEFAQPNPLFSKFDTWATTSTI